MRFIYSCDIHGNEKKYEKLLQLAIDSKTKNIVLAGDLFPKKAKDREILQREFIYGWFKNYLNTLNEKQIKLILILGNDDVEAIEDEFNEIISEYKFVYNIDKNKVDIEDISFIGLSTILDTPFYRKNRIAIEENMVMPIQKKNEIEIEKGKKVITAQEWEEYRKTNVPKMEDILKGLPEITNGKKGIFVFHYPPFGIGLGNCKDGDIIGSRAILQYILLKKPYITLHGHVHEAPNISGIWKKEVGNSICINCGQTEFEDEKLHFVAVDTNRNLFYNRIVKCDGLKKQEKSEEAEIFI